MDSENMYAPAPTAGNPRRRRLLIITSVLLLIIVIVVIVVLTRPKPAPEVPDYVLTSTQLHANQNFGRLDGNNLYAYNGLAFYATDVTTGAVSVLNGGQRLPAVSDLYWAGSKGAFLDFSNSFSLTAVDQKLKALNLILNDNTKNYLWYFDFASGNLTPVSTRPIQSGAASFDKNTGTFYYVSSPDGSTSALYAFNINSSANKTLVSNLKMSSVSSVTPCDAADGVCVIGNLFDNPDSQHLFGVGQDGSMNDLYDSKGALYATNNGHVFVAMPREQKKPSPTSSEDVEYGPTDAFFYDTSTKKSSPLGIQLTGPEISTDLTDDGNFFMFDSSLNAADKDNNTRQSTNFIGGTYVNGKASVTQKSLSFASGAAYNGYITGFNGISHDAALMTALDNRQFLFSTNKYALPDAQKPQDVQNIIAACQPGMPHKAQYFTENTTFRVFIMDDGNFANHVQDFSRCMLTGHTASLIGYNFEFSGVDPVNDRITTD